ncbi:hypothetical protein R9C00_16805 [Flammeovirgaceae bacterium SG7u.111]|nr:hypothetical protein [Flammeovirgaceae bacterium SG7u.132]WPO33362.1 hypothetical protein R9C00_16805 [Flammeovirgaceae bacterium SG7u.111]
MKKLKLPHYLVRKLNFEYWPFWFFYIPLYIYAPIFALRSRSFTYFTAANPGMRFGGVMGESKASVLERINEGYLPKSTFISLGTPFQQVLKAIAHAQISYPFIAKPNVGERGRGVEKIENENAFKKYLVQNTEDDLIIQEFVDYELELGILYHRMPDEAEGHITSVVIKDFLTIEGDGKSKISELVEAHVRAYNRADYFKEKLGNKWNEVLGKGAKLKLEPIGNHCRGTTFLNGNYLISKKLEKVFDKISTQITGYNYGRFDLKVKSLDDLYRGKNIKILELNGVSSEPAHIYDPSMNLITAYRDLFQHAKIIWKVGKRNHELGVEYESLPEFLTALFAHHSTKKKGMEKEEQAEIEIGGLRRA